MPMPLYDPIYGYSGQPIIQPGTFAPQPQTAQTTNPVPFLKVVTVKNESEAKSIKMAPGSTLLASDESEPIIWFIKANDVGPNTVIPIPFDPKIFNGGTSTPLDLTSIESRLTQIEERMKRYESDAGNDKSRQQSSNSNNGRR